VVVGIDQARQQHVLAGVEHLLAGLRRALAGGQHLFDQAIGDDQAASGVEVVGGEDRQGVFQPGADRGHAGRLL
jgi:hypothetical protein